MIVTLKQDSNITVNGITLILAKGTEVELPCQSPQEAQEMCVLTKLSVDLSYTEDGIKYIAGAGGKFIAVPKVEKPKVVKPKAEPKVAKVEVEEVKKTTKAKKK